MVMQWRVVTPGGLNRYYYSTEPEAYRAACVQSDSWEAPVSVERSEHADTWVKVYTVHPRLVTFEEV